MRGNDKVRFCDHCAKHVHDLSEMTPEAALELVERSEGRLCVRYVPDTAGAPTFREPEPAPSGFRMPQLRLAAGVLAAALTGGLASAGTIPAPPGVIATPTRPVRPVAGTGLVDLTVTVAPNIRYVNLPAKLVSEETGETMRTVSDPDGHIRFADVPFGKYRVEIKTALFGTELRFEIVEAVRELKVDIGFHQGIMGGISLRDVMESWEWVCRNNQRAAETPREAIVYADWNVALAEAQFERAVAVEDLEKVRTMLKAGFDLNRQAAKFDDPLIHRLMRQLQATPRTQELVAALTAAGADVNAANRFGVTPLMYAVLAGPGQVNILLAAGAKANAADDNGRTPLMLAAYDGKLDVVKLLVQAGADVNARDAKGQSALDYVTSGKANNGSTTRTQIVRFLKKTASSKEG